MWSPPPSQPSALLARQQLAHTGSRSRCTIRSDRELLGDARRAQPGRAGARAHGRPAAATIAAAIAAAIAGRHEQARSRRRSSASGVPPTRVATTGAPGGHRFEQHVRQRLVERRHHRDVGGAEHAGHVGAQPGERSRGRRRRARSASRCSSSRYARSGGLGLADDQEPRVRVARLQRPPRPRESARCP